MSKIVIKDSKEFERIINELEGTIPLFEDIFQLQDRNYSMIDGTDNYRGECQQVISDKYKDVRKNYEPIDNSLKNYIKYLKITLENYKKYENTIDKSIEDNENNLNVN